MSARGLEGATPPGKKQPHFPRLLAAGVAVALVAVLLSRAGSSGAGGLPAATAPSAQRAEPAAGALGVAAAEGAAGEEGGADGRGPLTAPLAECADAHASCAAWARDGECDANPGYMVRGCPVACGTCGRVFKPECSADGPSAVVAGDIAAMFERAATLEQYEPHVLSREPWVLMYDAFLSATEAAEVRRAGGHDFQRSLAGDGVTSVRTSSTSWCNVPACETEPIIRELKVRVLGVLRMPEGNSEHLQTLRYEAGQFYKLHHDQNANPLSAWGPRVYTCFIYLSDVEEGGETRFPHLNLTVRPRTGRAVIWPSVYDHDVLRADMRTEHEALPVLRGEKYASNLWLHLRDFQGPLREGCGNTPARAAKGEAGGAGLQ